MSSITTIYLIRHGDTEYPTDSSGQKLIYGPEAKLTEKGIQQMHALALRLREAGIQLNTIYTSPFVRARQSAEILARALDISHIIDREDLADIRGPHHIGLAWEKTINGNLPRFTNHETHEQLAARMLRVFYEIYDAERGNHVGIVGHGDPFRVLIYRLQNREGSLPPIAELNTYDYLNKGEAWKLSLDDRRCLVSLDFITTREGRSPRRERED